MAGIQSIDKTTLVSLQVFKNGHLVDELPLFRENWEEYGGRQERTGLGEAVWRSEDPFSFHRLVAHDGAEKEAAELRTTTESLRGTTSNVSTARRTQPPSPLAPAHTHPHVHTI